MPRQFQGSFGNGVGAIVALVFIRGNGFDYSLGGLVFSLERWQCHIQNEFGLIGRELRRRHGSSFHEVWTTYWTILIDQWESMKAGGCEVLKEVVGENYYTNSVILSFAPISSSTVLRQAV